MRRITEIIVHCTATIEGKDYTIADIDRWHRDRGFNCIGYHYVVNLKGEILTGRPEEQIGAHCTGHNANSIGVCYVGGLDADLKPKDTRTKAQKDALCDILRQLSIKYPDATIHGHREFANKACPCFDAAREYAIIG